VTTNTNKKEVLKYRAFQFSVRVVRFVSSLPNERIYWIIIDQLTRAATSIGANIIEAQAASSKKDFIKFFQISLKSATETLYWLCILRDGTEVDKREIDNLIKEAKELGNILGASLLTLKGKKKF